MALSRGACGGIQSDAEAMGEKLTQDCRQAREERMPHRFFSDVSKLFTSSPDRPRTLPQSFWGEVELLWTQFFEEFGEKEQTSAVDGFLILGASVVGANPCFSEELHMSALRVFQNWSCPYSRRLARSLVENSAIADETFIEALRIYPSPSLADGLMSSPLRRTNREIQEIMLGRPEIDWPFAFTTRNETWLEFAPALEGKLVLRFWQGLAVRRPGEGVDLLEQLIERSKVPWREIIPVFLLSEEPYVRRKAALLVRGVERRDGRKECTNG